MNFPPGEHFIHNMDLVGYADLDGRPAFKLALHKSGGRWFFYTAALWEPGLNVVDVTDPSQPKFLHFLPGPPNTWTLQVQIAEGRMITSMERSQPGWGDTPGAPYRRRLFNLGFERSGELPSRSAI